nr:ATP-binding cassette domain-containing protein [Niveispirillum sp. BGYR6]
MGRDWRHWFRRELRVPPIRQRQDSECAVAALAMILAHYGQPVPMERLRQETGVSRDGCTLATIAATARRLGFTVQSYSRDGDGLAALGFPLLVQLDFNHAVVVEGVEADRVRVCDPAQGPLCLDRAEFDDRFTGIVQRIRPGPDLPPPAPPRPLPDWLSGLWGWLAPVRGWLALALLLTLAGWAALGWAVTAASPVWLLPGLGLLWLRLCLLRHAGARAAAATRATLIQRLAEQPARFFTYRLPPLLAQQMEAPDRLAQRLAGVEGVALLDGLGALLPLALLCQQAPAAGALAGVGFLATLGLLAGAQISRLAPGRVRRRFGQGMVMLPADSLIHIAPLKLAGRLRQRLAVLAAGMAQRISARQRVAGRTLPPLLAPLLTLGAVQLAGGAGAVALGLLPVLALLRLVQVADDPGGWADELASIADLSPAPAGEGAPTLVTVQPALAVTGLTFGHRPGAAPLFSLVDLTIPPGAQVGLTGGPGAGCSSLGRLLAGQMPPWAGQIFGPERRLMIDAASPFLAGSLRDNLTLWNAAIPEAEVENALRLAEAWALVQARGGLDQPVEQGATGFSGGERRRLILARALLHRPGLLVLDGLFDCLDLALERRIRANLAGAGISLLVISRRAATLAGGDGAWELTPQGLMPWQPVAGESEVREGPGTTAPLPPLAPSPAAPAMAAALAQLARRLGRACATGGGGLDDLARDAGLLLRPVRLTGPWRVLDGSPLLMAMPDGGALALVAHKLGGYRGLSADGRLSPLPTDLPDEALAVLPLRELRGGPAALAWAGLRLGGGEGMAGFAAMLGAGGLVLLAGGLLAGPGLCLLAAAGLVFAWGWSLRDRALARGLAGVHLALWYRLLRLPAAFLHRQPAAALEGRLDSLDDIVTLGPAALWAGGLGLVLLALGGLSTAWMLALLPPVAALGWLTARGWVVLRQQMAGDQRFLAACLADFPALRQMGAGAGLLARWGTRAEQALARMLVLAQRRPLVWLAGLGLAGLAPPGMAVPLVGALLAMEAAWRLALLGPAVQAASPLLIPMPEAGLVDDRSLPPPQRVELADMHFRYPGAARPALTGVSLSLAGGQVVGLTGPSGGGKTTLLRLLLGLETPDQGELRVDGAPCTPQRLFALRRHMDVVEQDMRLPLATVRHHLTGDNPRPLEELETVLRLVGLWEMVAALPMGLQSLLSDAMLGAGEVQRLHIARCLLTRPRLLILDEATTALDQATEARVLAALREAGCACLLVSHRPESLALADRVLRLEEGRLVP